MMDEEYNSRFCKEPDCLEFVDTEVDKSYDSVMYKNNGFLNCFYPSKKCEHGFCSYHARKAYYKKFFERVCEEREKYRERNIMKKHRLFKLGGNDNGYASPTI